MFEGPTPTEKEVQWSNEIVGTVFLSVILSGTNEFSTAVGAAAIAGRRAGRSEVLKILWPDRDLSHLEYVTEEELKDALSQLD